MINTDWMGDALCKETPTEFFPKKGHPHQVREAILICRKCAVRGECLEYALAHHEQFGVWGGMTVHQRADVARERRNKQDRHSAGRSGKLSLL